MSPRDRSSEAGGPGGEVRSGEASRLDLRLADPPLVIVVGSGGVGKTTLAAAMGLESARSGVDTLVMTFDPSLRLKDALGVGETTDEETEVPRTGRDGSSSGRLHASLLDAGKTFDRLVERYAPDEAARDRILGNRYYQQMASRLGGILEYMAVERLYEVASSGRYQRVILDTPPTSQAIDFLEAPERVVSFLESGALKIALRPWFDDGGKLKVTSGLGFFGRGLESFLDRIVGVNLLRDMSEFFRAFEPLFQGFRGRAEKVGELLGEPGTRFVLVTGPGETRIPDTLFFARRLKEAGYRLGPLVVNRVHPELEIETPADADPRLEAGAELFSWLGETHRRGISSLRELLPSDQLLVEMPLEAGEPTDLRSLGEMGRFLGELLRDEAVGDEAVGDEMEK